MIIINHPIAEPKIKARQKLLCPGCGHVLRRERGCYKCSNYDNGCHFYLKDTYASKKLTTTQLENLIIYGNIGDKPISGFVNKYGKKFTAFLHLSLVVQDGLIKACKVNFTYPEQDEETIAKASAYAKGLYCPGCQSPIVAGKRGWECSEHCGFSLHYEIAGRDMTGNELFELIMRGETPVLHGFVSKNGTPFSASIKLAEDGRSTDLVFINEKEHPAK